MELSARSLALIALIASVLPGCSIGFAEPALVTAPLGSGDGSADAPDAGASPDAGAPGADAGLPVDGGTPDAGSGSDAGVAPDAGVDPCAAVSCSTGARCEPATARCVCSPGFTGDGMTCTPVTPGTPASRTELEVCTAFRAAQARREPGDGFTASTATCDRGVVSRQALDDALVRLNFYRWLAGLGPTVDDGRGNEVAQACALVSAWNPAGPQAHFPQSSATCYSADGAAGAGSSNIAWGARDAADAIDLWMIDFGNESTFGHRRWLLNPPLNPVGIGHYRGGNNYGSASCISVFGGSGSGPRPDVTAFPPAGYSPTALTQWHWTIHGNLPLSGAAVSVVRVGDAQPMPVRLEVLQGSYGQAAVAIFRDGWNPVAGQTYRVTLVGTGGVGRVEYDVMPTDCL
jgi:hypothetical protein